MGYGRKKHRLACGFLAVAVALGAMYVMGATNYVDCTMEDYAGHDGTSWAKAFKTIQEGVDAAAQDDVVLVAPGYYDEGGKTAGSSDNYLTNRVYISKRITVRSRDGRASRDKTFIVGRHATEPQDPEGMGMGVDAIRCVKFMDTTSALGAVVEGFTLINGATHYYNKSNQAGGYDRNTCGGGADFCSLTTSAKTPSFLVDCVISNCVAARGGGIYFGNAVRCRFTCNYASGNSTAVRDGNIYWCILDANWGSDGTAYLGGANAVNCTVVNSPNTSPIKGNSDNTRCIACNCVALQHTAQRSTYVSMSNCVIAADSPYAYGASVLECNTNTCRLVGMDSYQFVSTATGDFRPLSTGDLIGAGDASLLSYIPEKYRYTDYDGNTVDPAKPLHAGAIQTPVTPVGGCIKYTYFGHRKQSSAGLNVRGYPLCHDNLYTFAMKFPDPYRIECQMPLDPAKLATRKFFAFSVNKKGDSTTYRFPLRGTTVSYVIAPPPESELEVSAVITENSLWTDPTVPDDAEMDGTEEHPYNTLQAAVSKAELVHGFWCIFAKKGIYDKGGAVLGGLTNRFAVTRNDTYVSLYSVDGPEKTFIVGAGDESSGHKYKFGTAAIRCAASNNGVTTVNGFTLTGARTADTSGANGYGGAAFANAGSGNFLVADCIITNCAATRGPAAWLAHLQRCYVVDCVATISAILRYGSHAGACVFKNMTTVSNCVVGDQDFAYNCTIIGAADRSNTTRPIINDARSGLYNTVAWGLDTIDDTPLATINGLFYGNVKTVGAAMRNREGCTEALLGFADPSSWDYALYSSTAPVVTGGSVRDIDKYWLYLPVVDIEGNEFEFGPDGRVIAGAYARTKPSITVTSAASTNMATATVSPEGGFFLTEDTPSLTFTAPNAATRNFRGFYLDGELVTAASSYTCTYDVASAGRSLNLEARYVPYWYVDPTKSDSNDGRDWDSAKRTLAGVMTLAVPGDTVFAAPGVYEEGDMIQHKNSYKNNDTATLRARVVLTNGVKLVSRDGPETTIIKGAPYIDHPSSLQKQSSYGLGADALRCAFLYPNAVLDGFTLSGGRSAGGTAYDENDFGAGATGWYNNSGIYPEIRNCIVTNCIAERGAGVTHIKAVNCRFYDCRCFNNSACAIHGRLINCLFDWTKGTESVVGYWTEMRNCTFGKNNEADAVVGVSAVSGQLQNPAVYNTLILKGRVSNSSGTVNVAFTNCAFTTYMQSTMPTNVFADASCIVADASMLQVDEAGRPVVGANLAIDAGDTNYLNQAMYPTDVEGNPRAINGLKMDIGCYEADWKARYGRDLGGRVAVSDASPAVYESESRTVMLYDSNGFSCRLANPRGRYAPQTVSFRVVGEGSLSLSINDGEAQTFVDTGAVQKVDIVSTQPSTKFDFSFSGAGSAELISCVMNDGTIMYLR